MPENATSETSKKFVCPSCKKGISSVSKLFGENNKVYLFENAAENVPFSPALRSCGHIHCGDCVDTLLRPALKKAESDKAERPSCLECGKTIKSASKDLISLKREGTGFASAGGSETRKKGIAFQG